MQPRPTPLPPWEGQTTLFCCCVMRHMQPKVQKASASSGTRPQLACSLWTFGCIPASSCNSSTADTVSSGRCYQSQFQPCALVRVLSGPDVWDVVHRVVPPRQCPPGCHCLHCKDKDAWLDVAEALKLNHEQKCKIIVSR